MAQIADHALAWAGDRVVLRGADDTVSALVRWRWLSLSVPPDLLIAALAARHGVDPRTARKRSSPPRVSLVAGCSFSRDAGRGAKAFQAAKNKLDKMIRVVALATNSELDESQFEAQVEPLK